jgi:hypothetical protein
MTRILLAVEEFNELIFLEKLLKKLGFDVLGVQNDTVIPEKLMSFNPELLIITSQGNRVNGAKVLARLKTKGNFPKTIFLNPRGRAAVTTDKSIVAALDSPVSPRTIIELLSSVFGLDEEVMLEKYEKSSDYVATEEKGIHVQSKDPKPQPSGPSPSFQSQREESSEKKAKRSQKYKELATKNPLPPFQGLKRSQVVDQVKEFRNEEKQGLYKSIDEERVAFAKALSRQYTAKKRK